MKAITERNIDVYQKFMKAEHNMLTKVYAYKNISELKKDLKLVLIEFNNAIHFSSTNNKKRCFCGH